MKQLTATVKFNFDFSEVYDTYLRCDAPDDEPMSPEEFSKFMLEDFDFSETNVLDHLTVNVLD